jgi:hypothetical protein
MLISLDNDEDIRFIRVVLEKMEMAGTPIFYPQLNDLGEKILRTNSAPGRPCHFHKMEVRPELLTRSTARNPAFVPEVKGLACGRLDGQRFEK